MTQRIRNLGVPFTDRPFNGDGVSLYVNTGSTVQYRNLRVLTGGSRRRRRGAWIKGSGGNHDISGSVLKTARRASAADPATQIDWSIPADLASSTVIIDVRRYADDVENETDNSRTRTVELDSNRDSVDAIHASAEVVSQEKREGGIVRLTVLYKPSSSGVQADLLRATATAGPTSPADATVNIFGGERLVEIDTPALSDASAYTYTIRAENEAGTVTKDLITGLSVTADASGPPAPTDSTVEVV